MPITPDKLCDMVTTVSEDNNNSISEVEKLFSNASVHNSLWSTAAHYATTTPKIIAKPETVHQLEASAASEKYD